MRAVIRQSESVSLTGNAPTPTPKPGEAVVRPTRVAVASPDLGVASGRVAFTGIMGHEFVGVVEAIEAAPGREDQKKLEGKRVVGSPVVSCGTCDRCRGGLSQHCPTRCVLGLRGRDGCFAERFTIPVSNLVEVPRTVNDEQAVFANAVAAAIHAAHMLRIEGKPYVTVLGDGVMGLLCAQVMARLNASVRLLGTQPAKFVLCEKWGIKHRHVAEVGRRQDQDVIVDCTGSREGLDLALQLVRPRGKVLLKAGPAPHVPQATTAGSTGAMPGGLHADLSPAAANEIDIIGSAGGRIAEGIGALARSEVEVLSLISSRFRLGDALAALKLAALPDAVKVLMEV